MAPIACERSRKKFSFASSIVSPTTVMATVFVSLLPANWILPVLVMKSAGALAVPSLVAKRTVVLPRLS